jgi:PII-like signaling protein
MLKKGAAKKVTIYVNEDTQYHLQPIVVTVIDSEENIRRLLPALEEMVDTGLIAISDVQAVRITK